MYRAKITEVSSIAGSMTRGRYFQIRRLTGNNNTKDFDKIQSVIEEKCLVEQLDDQMEERSAFEERFFAAQAFLAEIIGTESPNTHVQSLSDAMYKKLYKNLCNKLNKDLCKKLSKKVSKILRKKLNNKLYNRSNKKLRKKGTTTCTVN
nr:unnamed protein product [Callosobruchus analis]